ncbi:MAG: hypothetical protein AAFP26_08240, partial [Planctomycetota bacterium]
FALEVEPDALVTPSGAAVPAPQDFRRALAAIRVPRSAEAERADREIGARVEYLPLPQVEIDQRTGEPRRLIPAEVSTSGERRQRVTLHIPDAVYVSLNVETGKVAVQLKAKALWSMGVQAAMERYLGLVSWWVSGRLPGLSELAPMGWRTTNVEACSDFVGLSFSAEDASAFIGFRKNQQIGKIGRVEDLETLNVGSRRSGRVSLCIYDKDRQLKDVKGGDDSTYRAVHRANGWDGEAERRRVEFRLKDGGLTYEGKDGERIDLRDPATLADREAMGKVWAIVATKHRLIVPGSATRKERCRTDPRWESVIEAAGVELCQSYRQTREAQRNTWEESCKRAIREHVAAKDRIRVLLDVPEHVSDAEVCDVLGAWMEAEPTVQEASRQRRRRYGDLRSEHIGEEIRTRGKDRWQEMEAQRWNRGEPKKWT